MDMTLLKEGAIVMVIGMGTVFFFLTIMIGAMNINEKVLKLISKFFPEEVSEVKTTKKKAENSDDEIALAIACAINRAQKAWERIFTMENNEKNMPKSTEDRGALWAILLTLAMVVVMAVLKHFIG